VKAGYVTVKATTHAGTYGVVVDGSTVWTGHLAKGQRLTFGYPINGKKLIFKHDNEMLDSADAKCGEVGASWLGEIDFFCKSLCD
jgi:hypothetical protein